MKEAITKFDLEAAFKALDEIDVPVADKVRANRPALTEIFSHKSKFDSLMEEYYDVGNTAELEDAQEAREAEVAKAKLARIEKIVDLEADSPEDLLTSYVGKYIIQCPQCMTLFYKNPEDVVESEEDPTTVNVNEVCQHCGNESGYTLVGKVDEAAPEELDNFDTDLAMSDEVPTEETPAEEVPTEEEENLDIDLDALNLDDADIPAAEEEEEKKEESFTAHEGEPLVEELTDDTDLDAKLEAHNEYIEYLRDAIAQEEEKLEKATNAQVKVAIQRNIDAYRADLESALPEAVKNDTAIAEEPIDEPEIEVAPEKQEESCEIPAENTTLTEELHEEKELEVSDDEFEKLINTPEFKKPISDIEARAMIDAEKEAEEEKVEESVEKPAHEEVVEEVTEQPSALDALMEDIDDLQETVLESLISDSLVKAYGNVAGYRLTECAYSDNKFTVDGTIYFTSGNTRKTTYSFTESCEAEEGKIGFRGLNEKLGRDKQFTLTGYTDTNRTFIAESLTYTKN